MTRLVDRRVRNAVSKQRQRKELLGAYVGAGEGVSKRTGFEGRFVGKQNGRN